jgi:hypothetical protein
MAFCIHRVMQNAQNCDRFAIDIVKYVVTAKNEIASRLRYGRVEGSHFRKLQQPFARLFPPIMILIGGVDTETLDAESIGTKQISAGRLTENQFNHPIA